MPRARQLGIVAQAPHTWHNTPCMRHPRDLITASCYLALAVDLLLGSQRAGQAQADPKRVYELLEAAKFAVSPPLFRVQVDGQWHPFEIRGNKIHSVN